MFLACLQTSESSVVNKHIGATNRPWDEGRRNCFRSKLLKSYPGLGLQWRGSGGNLGSLTVFFCCQEPSFVPIQVWSWTLPFFLEAGGIVSGAPGALRPARCCLSSSGVTQAYTSVCPPARLSALGVERVSDVRLSPQTLFSSAPLFISHGCWILSGS